MTIKIFKNISEWWTSDMITDRNAILGNPKFGKSTLARLKMEHYSKKKWPIGYIDPAGIGAAVRAVLDDVVIIGGEYGDYRLEDTDRVLPKIMEEDINFIFDVFELDNEYSKEIVGDVFDFLFEWHKATRKVRNYILDECDYFIPQYHFDKVCKENIVKCVTKGRMFGMGFDFITQNFTMIEKTVLKMVDNTIIFNLSDPIDLKRVGALLGESVDSKIKHLSIGKCLIYNKIERSTYTVDKPESPSLSSTPKLGQTFEKVKVKPLRTDIMEKLG